MRWNHNRKACSIDFETPLALWEMLIFYNKQLYLQTDHII